MYQSSYLVNGILWLFLVATFTLLGLYFAVPGVLAFCLGANAAAFALFFVDKNAAGSALGRVPEVILYVALWFGIIGGFVGMFLIRHKTRKASFQLVAFLMLFVQLVLGAWFIRDVYLR